MDVEFDAAKDGLNIARHGVSLRFGARLFDDADMLIIATIREQDGEDRYKAIGVVEGKLWTAIHVRRGDAVRFVSVRMSNDGEARAYRS